MNLYPSMIWRRALAESVPVRHEMGVSPIKSTSSTRVAGTNYEATVNLALGPTIPEWLRSRPLPDDDRNSPSDFESPYRLTNADWSKNSLNDNLLNASTGFPADDDIPSPGNSHVPSSRSPSLIPTCAARSPTPAKDNQLSSPAMPDKNSTTSIPSNSSHPVETEKSPSSTQNHGINLEAVARAVPHPESPSHSAMEEDSVLHMITRPSEPESSDHESPTSTRNAGKQLNNEGRPVWSSGPSNTLAASKFLSDQNSDAEGGDYAGGEERSARPRKRPRVAETTQDTAMRLLRQTPRKRSRNTRSVGSSGHGNGVKVKKEFDQSTSGSAKKRKGKKRNATSRISWPEQVFNEDGNSGTHIQCDFCEHWYHCGCVGFSSDDPKLEKMRTFKCPPCTYNSPLPSHVLASEQKCARPNCSLQDTDDLYFVERIIGRRMKDKGKQLWLVKWLNYPIWRATWEGVDSLGENAKLIETFTQDLKSEGIKDDLSSTILLKEASNGGWNVDEPDVIPFDCF
ncbi:hypothetical protein GYMLUDRAFT_720901 [Collybiopsis luxurians FD-317 M1]|nr:hypothetical protein GYMLUDRAFT_720901 [Collybiopsis luxurians FD-317 M1]